jgi:hypothetical protein
MKQRIRRLNHRARTPGRREGRTPNGGGRASAATNGSGGAARNQQQLQLQQQYGSQVPQYVAPQVAS